MHITEVIKQEVIRQIWSNTRADHTPFNTAAASARGDDAQEHMQM